MPLPSTQTAELLDRFKRKIIGHSLLKAAFVRIMDLIEEPADVEVAALIGPTGAGKSTLLDRVKQAVLKQKATAMEANPGLMPVIAVDAPAPELGSFSWREMYLRLLVALKEPACDWQVALKDRQPGKPGVVRLSSLNHIELKGRVESAFRCRGAKVLLVDEAQHLCKMASGRRLQDQTDTVKGLAKSTGAFVVLFGTYDLIPLLGLNGQVARRFASVHLPRYRCDEPNQWRDYQTAIRSFEGEIQLARSPDLIRNAEMLYRGSAGCIGILKSWLTAAYSQVLRADGGAMTKDVLQSTRLPTLSLRKIIDEIVEGESHWAKCHAEDRELDRLLGLTCLRPVEVNQGETRSTNARSTPVGIRKPTRDPIGLEAATV
jgi:energy-coupling factor transporter ATP-binding protein EcfA2